MRAELRSRARTFARALDFPDKWLTDEIDLVFAMMPWENEYEWIVRPALDHTEVRRDPVPYDDNPLDRARLTTVYPLDPPELRL